MICPRMNSPWEVGLGWAFSKAGQLIAVKLAAESLRGQERITFAGIYLLITDEALAGGEILLLDDKEVGVCEQSRTLHIG